MERKRAQVYRADLYGKIGKAGYYLYAGSLDSDRLLQSRFSDNRHFYTPDGEIPFQEISKQVLAWAKVLPKPVSADFLEQDMEYQGRHSVLFIHRLLCQPLWQKVLILTSCILYTSRRALKQAIASVLALQGIRVNCISVQK
jgi:hypothetical protein